MINDIFDNEIILIEIGIFLYNIAFFFLFYLFYKLFLSLYYDIMLTIH